MPLRRMKLALAGVAISSLAVLAGGTALLVRANDGAALASAKASLERAAQTSENTLNRHLLQADVALASLPAIFAALQPAGEAIAVAEANRLLRELNFQTNAFRDLQLIGRDGIVWAAAQSRTRSRAGSPGLTDWIEHLAMGAGSVFGPVRNKITGDWSLYLARPMTLSGLGAFSAVAEIPVPTLVRFMAENTLEPGTRVQITHGNGELVGSFPINEREIGKAQFPAPSYVAKYGQALQHAAPDGNGTTLAVVRPSLYGDLFIVASVDAQAATAVWLRSRNWIVFGATAVGLLIAAVAAALLRIMQQRERLEAERVRAGAVLEEAIEAMSDGFVMWDRDDRLVTCNRRYLDHYAVSAAFLRPGALFSDIIRRGAEVGQYPDVTDINTFVAEIVDWHRAGDGSIERLLPDGRWLLITERRMKGGGVVGIRTDITALKKALTELAQANDRAVRAADDVRRQNEALAARDRALEFMAHHDDLTKLPNRALFRKRLDEMLRDVTFSENENLALLYLDLDRFKDVNDTLGHHVGDALLKEVARRLSDCVGNERPIFRLGGDEFALICVSADLPAEAERLSRSVIAAIQQPFMLGERRVDVGASIGIALASDEDADAILKNADLALYRAKSAARGTHCVFAPEMATQLSARLEMEKDLRLALARAEFELAYQPIHDLATARVCGFEALLRWRHGTRGAISPEEFIPIAERSGLIIEIGAWVLQRACADVAALPSDLKIAVNLSPLQLAAKNIVDTVADALSQSGLAPARLELEITETALIENDRNTIEHLLQFRKLGVQVVLDDFGTGYSSLSHLRSFPLNKVKIDQSFVREMTSRPESAAIVTSVVQLAKRLGMATTAEGVETSEQLERVRDAGCTQAQGFFLAGRSRSWPS